MLPKYKINQQVIIKSGQGTEACIITSIKQDNLQSNFRYESTVKDTTRFFSEFEIIAFLNEDNIWVNV